MEAASENQSTWRPGRAERRLSAEGAPRPGISRALCYSVLAWFCAADTPQQMCKDTVFTQTHGGKNIKKTGGPKVRFKRSSTEPEGTSTSRHQHVPAAVPSHPIPPLLGTASTKLPTHCKPLGSGHSLQTATIIGITTGVRLRITGC